MSALFEYPWVWAGSDWVGWVKEPFLEEFPQNCLQNLGLQNLSSHKILVYVSAGLSCL